MYRENEITVDLTTGMMLIVVTCVPLSVGNITKVVRLRAES